MPDFEEMRNAIKRAKQGTKPLPVEPLLALFDGLGLTDDEIAVHLGTTRNAISGWRRNGIGLRAADNAAIRMGRHPLLIWGSDYWDAR